MKRAILATGGMDSTVLLYKSIFQENIRPVILTVDYGQEAFRKQFELLTWHTSTLMLNPPIPIQIQFPPWQGKPGLFLPAPDKLEDDSDTDQKKLFTTQRMRYDEMFIEGRNAIMVAYAMAYCSVIKVDELWAGYLYGEEEWENRRSYKLITGDNSPHFVDIMNLLSLTGFSHQLRFRAPFYEMRYGKPEVVALGKQVGVPFEKTHSCYWSEPCGQCDNCLLRKRYLK